MSDPYQLGSDIEWLKHTNDEMARLVKKRNGQLARVRGLCFLLLLALGWVVYKYQLRLPLEELWHFKSQTKSKSFSKFNLRCDPVAMLSESGDWAGGYYFPAEVISGGKGTAFRSYS